MLEALIIFLVVLWVLGFFVIHITVGFIHLLLLLALIVLIIRLVRGRPASV